MIIIGVETDFIWNIAYLNQSRKSIPPSFGTVLRFIWFMRAYAMLSTKEALQHSRGKAPSGSCNLAKAPHVVSGWKHPKQIAWHQSQLLHTCTLEGSGIFQAVWPTSYGLIKPRDHHAWAHSPCTYLWIDVILASDTLEAFLKWLWNAFTTSTPSIRHTWSSTCYKSLKFFSGANCLSQVTNDELKTFCLAEPLCYITCSLHCKRLEVSFIVCLLLHIGLEQSSKYHFPALNVAVGRPKFFMTCQCLSRGPDGLLFLLFCATVCNSCIPGFLWEALSDLWPHHHALWRHVMRKTTENI